MTTPVRQRIADWIFRPQAPEQAPVILTQRRIFILPTRLGYFFVPVLGLVLIASINYSLSLGYLLTFLLAGMGGVAMVHTFRNMAQLSVSPGKVEPVFAGETAYFGLVLHNTRLPRFAVASRQRNAEAVYADIPGARKGHLDSSVTLPLPVYAAQRGRLALGRMEIFTEYPVGLFHAWSYVDFGTTCLVYPKPDPSAGPLPYAAQAKGEGHIPIAGGEEFQSLRSYKPGDTPRQIAWKALAREQGLLSKEFGATASSDLWLDFSHCPGSIEARLSGLTWWVLEADRAQVPYGLRLPGKEIMPAMGERHRQACLEALALFGVGA